MPPAGLGVSAAVAGAASHVASKGGASDALFVAQLLLLLVTGRLLGEAFVRARQPSIMGFLVAGILLGPSFFGWVWPEAQHFIFPPDGAQKNMIDAVAQLGILMLLLLTGMETDLKLVKKVRRAAIGVSLTGIAVPFACGFILGQLLPSSILPHAEARLVPSLFLGTALAISSVKIVALVVREMNFMRRNLGQVIVASAIIEDTVGWVIIAVTFGIATRGAVDLPGVALMVAGVGFFLAASLTLGRGVVFWLIRWANDHFKSEFAVITMILVIMGALALMTQSIGVHTVLGAFVAGLLVGESPILTKHIRGQLEGLVTALFMPVFFGLAGLSADLTVLRDPTLAGLTIVLVAVASVGKFGGAYWGGALGGMSRAESLALGCAMNARGSTEVIVATIGLSMGALTENLFTMIVTMAVITTTAMPPMLRRALARLPMGKQEQERVEREALDEKGFVANLERLLVSVDDSPAGEFAAHVGGLIAGARGMPMTVMHLDDQSGTTAPAAATKAAEEGANRSAASARETASEPDPDKVQLTTVKKPEGAGDALAEESRKGYDLLLIGIAKSFTAEGMVREDLARLATSFDGPVAIIAPAKGSHSAPQRMDANLKILVPVNGTEASRRGAEIAFALARPTGATVVALYVSSAATKKSLWSGRSGVMRAHEEAVLRDISKLGERYDAKFRTAIELHGSADRAILRFAAGQFDLIVMGVGRRPGEQLFFGNTSAAVLSAWQASAILIAS